MKVNVTWSIDDNAEQAGKACAKKAVLDLVQTKIAIIFNSSKYNCKELLKGAKSILGTAPIIGCTTYGGIITQEGYITSKNGDFAGMLAIGDKETDVYTAGSNKLITARKTGQEVALQALQKSGKNRKPDYYMLIASSEEEKEYAKGIRDIIGDVPCFGGGITGKNTFNMIYTEEAEFSEGAAVAFFYTSQRIENIINSSYHETVHSGIITKATETRQIDEINGNQAIQVFREWTSYKENNDILENALLNNLAIKDSLNDNTIIKPITNIYNNSIIVGSDISENSAIIQVQTTKQELIDAPAETIYKIKNGLKPIDESPVAYLNVYSSALIDKININEIAKRIKTETEDTPFLMAFTDSEYGKGNYTGNVFGGVMISSTAICNKK